MSDPKTPRVASIKEIDRIFYMTSAILNFKISFQIRNQLPHKPPSTKYQRN